MRSPCFSVELSSFLFYSYIYVGEVSSSAVVVQSVADDELVRGLHSYIVWGYAFHFQLLRLEEKRRYSYLLWVVRFQHVHHGFHRVSCLDYVLHDYDCPAAYVLVQPD